MDTSAGVTYFTWEGQKAVGAEGVNDIMALLRGQGHTVIDLTDIPQAQHRDIDLMVDGRMVEVKTDSHRPRNLFLEVSSDGKPGCVFQSRADDWAYYFPKSHLVVWLNLAALQHWLWQHGQLLPQREIFSRRNNRTWSGIGVLVPLDGLVEAGVARLEPLEI